MDCISQFYDEIITGASKGKIVFKDGSHLNIVFNTKIYEDNKEYIYEDETKKGIVVPTLIIKNKRAFNEALEEYVEEAYDYYNDDYDEEIDATPLLISATLFVDATTEDFNDPVNYIKRKTEFIRNSAYLDRGRSLGNSSELDSDILVHVDRGSIYNEAPEEFNIMVSNPKQAETLFDYYEMPVIRFGVSDDTAYIYAIQSKRKNKELTKYQKRINRALFKIGEGFDPNEDTEEKYGIGNLKDVSASFVVAISIFMGYLKTRGVDKVTVSPFSICRWNNKKLGNIERNIAFDGNAETLEKFNEEQTRIQSNLTEKFIRTFLRVAHHFNNINVTSYPFEQDSSLHLVDNGEVVCNNKLLEEVYSLSRTYERERSL